MNEDKRMERKKCDNSFEGKHLKNSLELFSVQVVFDMLEGLDLNYQRKGIQR